MCPPVLTWHHLTRKHCRFFFNTISPGSAFFFPMGARLYNTLVNFIKQQYWQRGYDEVITPNMFSLDLWEVSGHAAKYKDDMFLLDVENGGKNTTFGLKPSEYSWLRCVAGAAT